MKTHWGSWVCPGDTLRFSCLQRCGKLSLFVEQKSGPCVVGSMAIKSCFLISCLLMGFNGARGGWIKNHFACHSLARAVSWKTLNLVPRWIKPRLFSITKYWRYLHIWPPVLLVFAVTGTGWYVFSLDHFYCQCPLSLEDFPGSCMHMAFDGKMSPLAPPRRNHIYQNPAPRPPFQPNIHKCPGGREVMQEDYIS